MTTRPLDVLRDALRTCPDHGLPDCSPLLNGCSRVNQNHAALAQVAALVDAAEDWLRSYGSRNRNSEFAEATDRLLSALAPFGPTEKEKQP